MRLLTTIAATALSGLAVEASQSARVFLFPSTPSSSAEQPRLPKEVARHILLQRTSRSRYGSDLRDIPNTIDTEAAVEYISRYGKSPAPLFAPAEKSSAMQLVVILEGIDEDTSRQLEGALLKSDQQAAFSISDPPSASANTRLMASFNSMDILPPADCDLPSMVNPFNTHCWPGESSVVKYDVQKSPKTITALIDNLPRLQNFVSSGELEVMLVLLPESSRASKLNHWSAPADAAGSVQRRQFETEAVLVDDTIDLKPTPNKHATASFLSRATEKPKAIPQCFRSKNTCEEVTKNCTGHGVCMDRYGGADDKSGCFVCACKATILEAGNEKGQGRKTKQWGGNKCQKEDISVQFWLIFGFTITIIGAVGFAIGLLYSVGDEQLPGVIGAGVSRSK
ncbi:hypothetical protein QBC39DRAFT_314860 [Podospora conica]|nr:hypothetical protein QBC39DRAFT_314860 [Schizothecium conicum]